MFKKIIWATDGSAIADAAFPFMKSLASEGGATIVIAHANELMTGRMGGYSVLADEDDIQQRLRTRADELREAGFDVEVVVRTAAGRDSAHLIAAIARETGAELIVAATVGHSALGGFFSGSVTQRLPHLAPCPVLIVPVHDEQLVRSRNELSEASAT
jgi:nucleotide-binding universal stress UspA family protein